MITLFDLAEALSSACGIIKQKQRKWTATHAMFRKSPLKLFRRLYAHYTSTIIDKPNHEILMTNRFITLSLILPILVGISQPAFAAGEFERGCQLYNLKDYKQARTNFEKAAKEFPNNWAVHYYLANTYLASDQASNARREYETCLKCNPNATTAKYCQDVIAKLGGHAQPASAELPSSTTQEAPGDAKSTDAKATDKKATDTKVADKKPAEASSPTLLHDQAMASETMKKADAECAKIMAEAKEKLANGATLSNQRWIRPDGTPFTDWTDAQREAISKDADDRCKQIMDHATKSTANLKN